MNKTRHSFRIYTFIASSRASQPLLRYVPFDIHILYFSSSFEHCKTDISALAIAASLYSTRIINFTVQLFLFIFNSSLKAQSLKNKYIDIMYPPMLE